MTDKMNIMIVDDEKIVRESLFHWFTKLGHTVEKASSGFEALERLEKNPFDLLFVDIRMPQMNGIELLEKVRFVGEGEYFFDVECFGFLQNRFRQFGSDVFPQVLGQNRQRANLCEIFPAKLQRTATDKLIIIRINIHPEISDMIV